jgi:RNA polymerase sigma-70 factor (ECF subfamily)
MENQEIISKAKKGDPQAVAQLYQEHSRALYRFIYYKVGSKEDAEDLTQDVFIAAFAGLPRFRGDAKFLNWCYEIAKRKIADLWKEKYSMPTVDIEAVLGLHTTDETAEMAVEREKDDVRHIDEATVTLGRLNGNYRLVLEYRFLKNYSIKETAEAMGISVSNAKVLQHRALKKAAESEPDL